MGQGCGSSYARSAGSVWLPDALSVKYPRAPWEWGWQWVFPATRSHTDRAIGHQRRHHLHETVLQRAVKEAALAAGLSKHASPHALRHYAASWTMPSLRGKIRMGPRGVPAPERFWEQVCGIARPPYSALRNASSSS